MNDDLTLNTLGFNYLEPIIIKKKDNKIIIDEEDLKKAINHAYEAGKAAGSIYQPTTPLVPPTVPTYPTYPYYPNITWSNGSEIKCRGTRSK